jgi:thymidylate synthase
MPQRGDIITDIRKRVEEDRGLLKKIQLHFPGFIGYRRREDLRQADSILRIQLADRIKEIRGKVEDVRQILTENYQLKTLETVGRTILDMQEFENLVRHAEQGYSGISWAIRTEETELNKLYEYDLSLLEGLASLERKADALVSSADNTESAVKELSKILLELKTKFKHRTAFVTQTEVC